MHAAVLHVVSSDVSIARRAGCVHSRPKRTTNNATDPSAVCGPVRIALNATKCASVYAAQCVTDKQPKRDALCVAFRRTVFAAIVATIDSPDCLAVCAFNTNAINASQ